MKKILTLFIICIVLLILDNSFVPFFAIKTYSPSLLLVFVICYSIINDKWEGLWVGVFSGALQDIFFSNGFGVNSLTNMIICVIAGEIGTTIFKEKSLIPIASNLALSLLKGVLVFIILYFESTHIDLSTVAYCSIYNMIVSIFAYKIVYKLCEKDFMQRKWKF